MTKKYIRLYFKRIFPIFALFAILNILMWYSCFNSYEDKMVYIREGITVTLLMMSGFIIRSALIIRFKKMIREQERMYSVSIDDDCEFNEIAYMICVSNNWIVFPANRAFYRENIKKISYKKRGTGRTADHFILVTTQDGKKYKMHASSGAVMRKIREWQKNEKKI